MVPCPGSLRSLCMKQPALQAKAGLQKDKLMKTLRAGQNSHSSFGLQNSCQQWPGSPEWPPQSDSRRMSLPSKQIRNFKCVLKISGLSKMLQNRRSYSGGGNYMWADHRGSWGGDLDNQSKVLYNFNQVSMRRRSHTRLLQTSSSLRAVSAEITFSVAGANTSQSHFRLHLHSRTPWPL